MFADVCGVGAEVNRQAVEHVRESLQNDLGIPQHGPSGCWQ